MTTSYRLYYYLLCTPFPSASMLPRHDLTVFHKASCAVTEYLASQSSSPPINLQWDWGPVTVEESPWQWILFPSFQFFRPPQVNLWKVFGFVSILKCGLESATLPPLLSALSSQVVNKVDKECAGGQSPLTKATGLQPLTPWKMWPNEPAAHSFTLPHPSIHTTTTTSFGYPHIYAHNHTLTHHDMTMWSQATSSQVPTFSSPPLPLSAHTSLLTHQ